MKQLPVTIDKNTDLFMFDSVSVSVNERIAVVDFTEMASLIDSASVLKNAIYCFLLVEGGRAEIEINGIRKRVSKGWLVCGVPGDSWIWHNKSDLKGRFILFEASFPLAGLKGGYSLEPISHINASHHFPFIALSTKRFRQLKFVSENMLECLNDEPVFWDLLRSELWSFIFLSEKEYLSNGNKGRKQEKENRVGEFINLVNKHYLTERTAAFYAKELNISTNYLNKLVKTSVGMSVREVILGRLLSEAKILLRLTEINVNELAYKLGFEDPNYFIRCFKKAEGITPGEYQKLGSL